MDDRNAVKEKQKRGACHVQIPLWTIGTDPDFQELLGLLGSDSSMDDRNEV